MDNHLFNEYLEMISLRGLTEHTKKSYSTYIRAYLDYVTNVLHKNPEDVSWAEMRDFIRWIQSERNLADRTINCCIAQLHFFTVYVLHKPWDASQLPLRKFDTYLPYIPTQEETFLFISTMPDLKAKTMLALLYSSGLRIGELCSLRYEDISRQNMRIHIRHAKARQDRYAVLSQKAMDLLTQYWFVYGKPRGYLFPQKHNPDKPISNMYLLNRIHEHEARLGWGQRLTCHTFRHAFGTHLYENGTDLLTIKSLLGHKSLSSTLIYVHLASNAVSNTVSPLDRMEGIL